MLLPIFENEVWKPDRRENGCSLFFFPPFTTRPPSPSVTKRSPTEQIKVKNQKKEDKDELEGGRVVEEDKRKSTLGLRTCAEL